VFIRLFVQEVKTDPSVQHVVRASLPPSKKDEHKVRKAWGTLLAELRKISPQKNLKVFISYAWETDKQQNASLQQWLTSLKQDLRKAGVSAFLDLQSMSGDLKGTMQQEIAKADFILPILTPRFLDRAKEPDSNLAFELKHMLDKQETNLHCIIPILRSGSFSDVVCGPVSPLSKFLVLTCTEESGYRNFLVGTSPRGLLPTILGLGSDDPAFTSALQCWHESGLTNLPFKPTSFHGRTEVMAELGNRFENFGGC
jgi:hypothetical protein